MWGCRDLEATYHGTPSCSCHTCLPVHTESLPVHLVPHCAFVCQDHTLQWKQVRIIVKKACVLRADSNHLPIQNDSFDGTSPAPLTVTGPTTISCLADAPYNFNDQSKWIAPTYNCSRVSILISSKTPTQPAYRQRALSRASLSVNCTMATDWRGRSCLGLRRARTRAYLSCFFVLGLIRRSMANPL